MAKLIGPLFSTTASGTINKQIEYANQNGVNIARRYKKPAPTATPAQVEYRIAVAVGAIITRSINEGNWKLRSGEGTIIDFMKTQTLTGETWNSAFNRNLIGKNRDNFNSDLAVYFTQRSFLITIWMSEAEAANPSINTYTRDGTDILSGQINYLMQRTLQRLGYVQLAFDGFLADFIDNVPR